MKENRVIVRMVITLSIAFLLIQSGSGARRVFAIKPAPMAEVTDLSNLDQLKEAF